MIVTTSGNMGSMERPLTPYSRDPSPSPSGTTMAAPAAEWPLASEAGDAVVDRATTERPKSRRGNTSPNGHRNPMLRANQVLKSHPVPSFQFHRPGSSLGQARGRSTSPGAERDATGLQIPPLARPPTRHGLKRPFNSFRSMSSESFGDEPLVDQRVRASGSKRIKHGLVAQLSRGAQVFSSAGSFFPFTSESSPAKTRISAPFGFRHVASAEHGGGPMGGIDHGPDADPEATLNQTHRVLLDVRTNSRLENRTSLPIAMPNVTSPIDESQFDAGCGHDSSRNSFNPFPSPSATPATVQVHQPNHAPLASRQRRVNLPRLNIHEVFKGPVNMLNVAFWASIVSASITAFSTASAITSIALHSDENEVLTSHEAVWLALSVAFCFASMVAIVIIYARRRTARVMASHRYSQHEDEFLELRNIIRQSTPTRVRNSDPAIELDDLTQRRVSGAASSAVQNERAPRHSSGGIVTTPEAVHIRHSSRIVAEGLHNLAAPPHSSQSKRAGGIFDAESVRTALYAQSIIKGRNLAAAGRTHGNNNTNTNTTSTIGIARSDSLLHSAARARAGPRGQQQQAPPSDHDERADHYSRPHSMESGTTVATFSSMGTETPMIARHTSRDEMQPSPPSSSPTPSSKSESKDKGKANDEAESSDSSSSYSSVSDPAIAPRIPHSVAVPDLASETNIPALPSLETQSTLSSLISSYADESEKSGNVVVVNTTTQGSVSGGSAAAASYTKTYSAPRPKEALGSHPVHHRAAVASRNSNPFRRLLNQEQQPHRIVTEAGTPDSQKSTERFPSYVDSGGSSSTTTHDQKKMQRQQNDDDVCGAGVGIPYYDIRDNTHQYGTFGRRGPMTPIDERGEGTVHGGN